MLAIAACFERAIDPLESNIRERYPKVKRIFLEMQSIKAASGPAG